MGDALGYARVSTAGQSVSLQTDALAAAAAWTPGGWALVESVPRLSWDDQHPGRPTAELVRDSAGRVFACVEPVGRRMWVVVLLDAEGEPKIPARKEGIRDSRIEAIWQARALADTR